MAKFRSAKNSEDAELNVSEAQKTAEEADREAAGSADQMAGRSPTPAPLQKMITLRVIDQNNQEIRFRVKMMTPLHKLMSAYCGTVGAHVSSYRFLFDGRRIKTHDTPQKLEMEDRDVIEAYVEQKGGDE